MSFFGLGGPPKLSSEQKVAAVEAEMNMIQSLLVKMTNSCTKKCIPKTYLEGELNKGEAVCLDRCAAKYFDVNLKTMEFMQEESTKMGFSG